MRWNRNLLIYPNHSLPEFTRIMGEALPNNMVVEPTTIPTTITELLRLVVKRIGESSGCGDDGIKLGITEISVVKELFVKLSECVGMTLNPLSLETEEGVGLDSTRRRLEGFFNIESGGEDVESTMSMLGRSKLFNMVSVNMLRIRMHARVYEEKSECGWVYMR